MSEDHIDLAIASARERLVANADVPRLVVLEREQQEQPVEVTDDRPAFPISSFPPALRAMVEEGAAAQGVNVAYWATPALGVIAGSIGATRRVALTADWCEPCVVFAATIGPSGCGKSVSLRRLQAPVARRNHALHLRTVAAQQQYASDLEAHKAAKGAGTKPTPPPMLAAMLGDATIEAVAARHADNERGLLVAVDELAGWLRGFDKYRSGGGDCQAWLSLHGGDMILVDRKGAGGIPSRICVQRTGVSVLGTLQPGTARRYLGNPEARETGLLARLLLAAPPVVPVAWSDREISTAVVNSYDRMVDSLLDLHLDADGEPHCLRLDIGARDAFVAFYNANGRACADARDSDLGAALAKLRGGAARLALIVALARAAENGRAASLGYVDEQSMRAGISLADWFAGEAARLYTAWDSADAADVVADERGGLTKLADRLFEIMATPQSMDDLHAATGRNVRADRLRAALAILAEAGRATPHRVVGPRGGRPREVWGRVTS